MVNNMNIVFMGTPEFAVPSLKALIDNFNVIGVFTQPDRPKGRGKKLGISPVKEVALEHGIPVYQPEKLRKETDFVDKLKEIKPDYIIVVAYGQILSKEVLDIPKYACINLHGSLLPKFRGAAPIQWSVIKGEKVTGNTTMLMDVGLDTGDMLLTDKVEITDYMTAGQLHDLMMESGAELLVKTINEYTLGNITGIKQDDSQSCYASMLSKEIALIKWDDTAANIHNLIRGLNPWPIAFTNYQGVVMKIYESEVLKNEASSNECGKILKVSKDGIDVATKEGILRLKTVQFPGKKPLKVEEFIKGNKLEIGVILN
ncbi:methionyl-tRNA formyltransferase [Clostridium cellulovorans 743B]|uniref:Methionyl-tRNA formyltransferase n=2 Tax=Clostridium cellulovorans TaxID=1493 RepID=D9SLA2_CLOC7|nr:methionyl-tRNA formyltransferase [Clostridium cellulovorans 743B]